MDIMATIMLKTCKHFWPKYSTAIDMHFLPTCNSVALFERVICQADHVLGLLLISYE